MTKNKNNICGVLNINKPTDMTSHDVVDYIRKVAGIRKVGHTGTLDPLARGVLPLCLGPATRIAQFLIAENKEYIVDLLLGTVTSTQDITGSIKEKNTVEKEHIDRIEDIPANFTGELQQIPPMVSAKHYKGKRLYELARKGVEVERPPCKISIHKLEIINIAVPVITFKIFCSKGTYVRTLCHDIGKFLGCGGCMQGLIRTRCGVFAIEEAIELEKIQKEADIIKHLVSIDKALASLPEIILTPTAIKTVLNGQGLSVKHIKPTRNIFNPGALLRLKTSTGELLAIGKSNFSADKMKTLGNNVETIKPIKVLVQS